MPKYSVVISIYNKEEDCKETIQSVLDQSYEDFELIIVNDNSTDNSEKVIKGISDGKIKYIKNEKNLGAGASRNRGITAARGKFIAFLDGDDYWYPHFLEEINLLNETFRDHNIFATAIEIEDLKGKKPAQYSFNDSIENCHLSLNFFSSSNKDSLIHSSAVAVTKKIFSNVGLFDETIKSGQDTDMWIRLCIDNNVAFSQRISAIYKQGKTSLYNSNNSVANRPSFEKFKKIESERSDIKKYIDLNRYSQAIRATLWNEPQYAKKFKSQIDQKNLNRKQKFLLQLPPGMIRLLFGLKRILERLGLRIGVFGS